MRRLGAKNLSIIFAVVGVIFLIIAGILLYNAYTDFSAVKILLNNYDLYTALGSTYENVSRQSMLRHEGNTYLAFGIVSAIVSLVGFILCGFFRSKDKASHQDEQQK